MKTPQEGWADEQVCKFFNVPMSTIRRWKKMSKREQKNCTSPWKPVPRGLGNLLGRR